MKRSGLAEQRIITVQCEQEAGVSTAAVYRNHVISYATFCAGQGKFSGMDVSEAQLLGALEGENARLKRQPDDKEGSQHIPTLEVEFLAAGNHASIRVWRAPLQSVVPADGPLFCLDLPT